MILKSKTKILLRLAKDITVEYNSNNLSKKINISHPGTFKALKSLEKENIVKGRTLGKAKFYNINFDDLYATKTLELALMKEAKTHNRWIEEFKELKNIAEIVILFGSTTKNQQNKDIDILVVLKKENNNNLNKIIKKKNNISLKHTHILKQTPKDLRDNLLKEDKVILTAISQGVVLFGEDKLIEVLKYVSRKKQN